MSEATDDFGAALGILLRSYTDRVGPKLGDFPHGSRGYQTLCEVVQGTPPSQAALAARLGIDRTMMTYLIDDLVSAGLVERRPNPDDRRQRRIVATERGREAIAALCGQVAEAEEAALGTLDADERAQFRRLLVKASGGTPRHTVEACSIVEEALEV
ncbi:MarR family winged helix-turn-helix transcriptional regulator [Actinoplanes sp. URMC 104]|uniref:MarR family winged helix-turn-helix transcriptional regulator n=1 Tax=Actinoplanes sp. URMC 104 TaxID=3423409 RepID=UPI003F1B5DAA